MRRTRRRVFKPFIECNAIWLPKSQVYMSTVKRLFTLELEDKQVKSKKREDRMYEVQVFRTRNWHGEEIVGLPLGDKKRVRQCLMDKHAVNDAIDMRPKFDDVRIKACSTSIVLRDYQDPAVRTFTTKEMVSGVLRARPRSGKTVMGVEIAIRNRVKTLVLVHQSDLLKQFKRDTFDALTAAGMRSKICKTWKDFRETDFCLATYQSFLSPGGKKLLRRIANMFGLVLTDEIHRAASKEYNNVLCQLNALQYIGLTGTPDRKDGKYDMINVCVGPIRITCKAPALKPKVQMVYTDLPQRHFGGNGWTYMVKYIATNKARNELIADHAVRDMLAGHHVVIPITMIEHGNLLEALISKKWEALGKQLPVAARFDGRLQGNKRDAVLDDIRDGKYGCTIAMRSMLTGVNVPRWSMIYTVIPIANAPTYTQEVTRVGTPMEGKNRPVVKCFLDTEMTACVACFRKMFFAVLNIRSDFTVSYGVLKYFHMSGRTIEQVASTPASSARDPSYTRSSQAITRTATARGGKMRGFGGR
ncbi:DNA helicase [Pseudomonas phage vB_PpuM-Amme-1]